MTLFYLELQGTLPMAESLKEKRMPLESLKASLKRHYNVSVLEVGDRDKWQLALIGIAGLAGSDAQADRSMDDIINHVDLNWPGDIRVQDRIFLL